MNSSSPQFQTRALVSVLTGFAFLLLAASGTVLFLAPPGRIANWTDWAVLGLRKSEWGAVHIWFAAVFLIGAALHIFYNLRALVGYFKHRLTRRIAVRREWLAAAALTVVVFAGTLLKSEPFGILLAWNEALKESWERPAERAPIPHAELLTFAALAEKGGVDQAAATARLAARGIAGFTSDTVVQTIAAQARMSAQQVFEIMVTPAGKTGERGKGAGGGIGRKTLAQLCADEHIDMTMALARLNAMGIAANEHLTLREIASRSGEREPYELLEVIRAR